MYTYKFIETLLSWEKWDLLNSNKNYNYKLFVAQEIIGIKKNIFYVDKIDYRLKPVIDIMSKLKLTSNIQECDYILVPHSWVHIYKNNQYINYLKKLSQEKPLLVVNTDDISPSCKIQNTLEFRTFLHPKENRFRKIIIPYPAMKKKSMIRNWKTKPLISFIGFVPDLSLGSLTSLSKSFIKSPIASSVYLNRKLGTYKLKKLKGDFTIKVIQRKSFTLQSSNINLLNHMNEYEENLRLSDYILCPRGFGNVSIRFYETISSGATPILIDSGSELPIVSDSFFWENNIIKVKLFEDWRKKILEDWSKLSYSDNYLIRQKENINIFSSELDLQQYLELIFSKYLL
jgi:hypothetical protein